jgi:hypothetical protein
MGPEVRHRPSPTLNCYTDAIIDNLDFNRRVVKEIEMESY